MRVSKALATLFGSAPDDMVGKDFNAVLQEFDALPPQAGAALSVSQEASGALLAPNKSDETAYVMQFVPSGQTHPVWHSVRSVPYRDPITKTDTIYSIGVDITTTIKQQRSEREMATTIQLVQDMASVGNWSVDLVAGTVYWSQEVHRIHRTDPNNYRPDLASGINFYHEDDREDVSRLVQLAIDKGEEFRFVKRIVAADGADVRIESFGVPILDEAGLTTKIVGVFREVAPSEVIEMSD